VAPRLQLTRHAQHDESQKRQEKRMSIHTASVDWNRNDAVFTDNHYSRVHRWRFDGGAEVPASSSPHVVRLPFSDPSCVDPEEAFVASLSSCHMLWFLGLAARQGIVVDSYSDTAQGLMARNAEGQEAITKVTLRPLVVISAGQASDERIAALHHAAHASCFLANSVKAEMVIEGRWQYATAIPPG
jgi:organic hydroperoxide reductase OsmC/OhrA